MKEDNIYNILVDAKKIIIENLLLELDKNDNIYKNRIEEIINFIKKDYFTIRKNSKIKKDYIFNSIPVVQNSLQISLANLKAIFIINNAKELIVTNMINKIKEKNQNYNDSIIDLIYGIVMNTHSIEFSTTFSY